MDDPWANAWGEPATTSKLPPAPAFPAAHTVADEEDITIPSWESQPSWSDGNNSNSLWGARSPALDKFPSWHSPYDDLPLGKSSTSLPEATELPSGEEEDEEEEPEPEPEAEPSSEPASEIESVPESPVESAFEPPVASPVLPPNSPFPPNSPPGSPDAFGTFESGLDDLPAASDPWAPSHGVSVTDSAAAWGAAWEPSDVEERADQVPAVVDEWEAAKQQKALRDKHVSPELLASLLVQFTELADGLYPPQPTPNLDPDDYRASRHKGLEGIDSLNPTIMRLLPTDLTLPPPRPFQKSVTAKHTTEALRLSRNAAFVRFSPLSHYSATKGSTAWEASVKSRPEVVAEPDLLPPGWRIVETKKDVPVADKKKTGHGGLLSFFGRRSGTPPVVLGGDSATPRSSSPASVSSPPASLDSSIKSPTSSTKSPITTSDATSASPSSAVSLAASINAAPPPPPPLVAPVASQTDRSVEPDPVTPVSAPSAVSRFLGRFGRKAPAAGERQQSLALSEGDFDFLNDIEGAAAAAGPSSGSDFAISGVLLDEPVALPAKLAPPPVAPRVPAHNPGLATHNNGQEGRPSSDRDPDELAIFGTFTPLSTTRPFTPPSAKPFTPPPAQSTSTPAPTAPAVPLPLTMSPVDSDIDFSAWGLDDEEKSGGVGIVRTESEPVARAPPRPMFNTRAATNARGAVPPPRRVTAIMSSGPSKPPAAVPKLDGAFGFLPPPRTQTQAVAPILAPPPGTKAPVKVTALLDDSDDFSDFHAPPQITPAASANSFYDTSFSSSTLSDRGLFSSTSSAPVPENLFDDFDDFTQASPHEPATLRTPSPPRPPAKSPRIPPPGPLAFSSAPPLPPPPPSQDNDDTPLALTRSSLQRERAASHQRTLSLVEGAAASSGIRWPAPESPLPEVLAPPPNASDPFGFNTRSTMQSQQEAFMGNALPPMLNTSFSAPPARALSPPVQPVLSPPAPPQKAPTPTPMGRFPPPPGSTPIRAFSQPAPSPAPQKAPTPTPMGRFPPPPGSIPTRAFTPPVPSPPPQKVAPAPTPMARFPPPPGAAAPMRTFSPPAPSQTPTLLPPLQNGMARTFSPPTLTSQHAVPTPPPMTSTGSGKSSGGLSAQDLSFFEGL
ncbi:hypothetical protein B0H12DRAFT_1232519 [Mycena haematopus]|nr:hypothetical protein B0H12DRAFT_1232519 [Mycena haematopus]